MAYKANPPGIRGSNLRCASIRGFGNKGTFFNPITSQNTATFNPALAPGLVAWWDFSDAAYLYTDSGTTPVSSNGDVVGQINDKSGNGNHLRQTDGTKKGTYRTNQINGYPIVRLDGSNDCYQCISSASTFNFLNNAASSVYFVVKSSGTQTTGVYYLMDNMVLSGSTGSRFGYNVRPDYRTGSSFTNADVNVVKFSTGSGTAVSANQADNFLPIGSFVLNSILSDVTVATANKYFLRKNGAGLVQPTADTRIPNTTQAPTYQLMIGAAGGDGASAFPCDLVAILPYNQMHGTTDRQYIENGLIARYAIS